MPTQILVDFGAALREARKQRQLSLENVAEEALGKPSRKGYVSEVERGKRNLSAGTIKTLATFLGVSGPVLEQALTAAASGVEEPNATDDRAAKLLEEAENRAGISEALLISLAYRFAEIETADPRAAHAGLEQALGAAQRLAAQGATLSNHPDFIDAVFAEVARLNAEAREDDAAAAFESALAREEEESTARKQKLLTGLRDQHILRGDADGLADTELALAKIHYVSEFDRLQALYAAFNRHDERGRNRGTAFDLRSAAALMQRCYDLTEDRVFQAISLSNLGNALQFLGQRGDTDALHRAVTVLETALELRTRDALPTDWAMAQMDLGNALQILAQRGDADALRRAVSAYEAALEVHTRDALPTDWARTQTNLGNALAIRGQLGDTDALPRAVAAYEAALEVHTRDALPLDWAITQMNLGGALGILGCHGDGDADALRRAVDAYEAVLEVHTRDALPLDWAITQMNLGSVLASLGERGDADALRRAFAACKAALEVFTRDALPLEWATTQNILGSALGTLGERGDVDALPRAVAAYEAALEVRTRDALPLDWAITRENMALCYEAMADAFPEQAGTHLAATRAAVADALTVYDPETMSYRYEMATRIRDRLADL